MRREIPGYERISTYRSELMGFAIVMILFCHLDVARSHNGIEPSILASVLHTFTVGVDIFMFLSGFGLYFSYTKKRPSYLGFVKARLSRVLPLYFIIAGLTYLIHDLLIRKTTIFRFFKDLTFLSWFLDGSTRYWFILGISVFYLLFPVLYRFLHGGQYGLIKLIVFSLAWWAIIGVGSVHRDWIEMFKMPLDRLPIFMFGIYCGKLAMEKRPFKPWEITFYALTGYFLFFLQKRTMLNNLSYVLYYPIRAFLGLSIMTTILAAMESLRRLSVGVYHEIDRFMRWLGGLTLECYLLHQSFLILFDFPYKLPQYTLVAFVLPVMGAAMIYWLRVLRKKKGTT